MQLRKCSWKSLCLVDWLWNWQVGSCSFFQCDIVTCEDELPQIIETAKDGKLLPKDGHIQLWDIVTEDRHQKEAQECDDGGFWHGCDEVLNVGGAGANTKAGDVMLLVDGVAMAGHEQVGEAAGGEHAQELLCFMH